MVVNASRDVEAIARPLLDVDGCGHDHEIKKRSAPLIVEALKVPGVLTLLCAGFGWDLARSSLSFAAPYYVNDETHDPFLVGLVGAAGWVFLLLGPCIGNWSDHGDRRHLIVCNMSVMALSTLTLAGLVLSHHASWHFMFFLMLILSFCNALDQTTRPPFASELLVASEKERFLGTFIAIQTAAYNVARVVGCQLVGLIVEALGLGMCLLLTSFVYVAGVFLSIRLPNVRKSRDDDGAGLAVESGPVCNRAVVSVFGVTVIANFFYWSYQPLIPVLGTDLKASPEEIGLLGSGPFCGGLLVSLLLTNWSPRGTGLLYCVGITLADLALAAASSPSFNMAFASLFAAGAFAGLFGTVQSAMVMSMVPPELRGRAMGVRTLAIGAGPFGMAALGKLASKFGAAWAIRYFALAGAASQVVWLCFMPDAIHVRRPL